MADPGNPTPPPGPTTSGPTPRVDDREGRKWAMICHLAALVGLFSGIGFIVGPLVAWLLKKDDHPLIDEQGKEALNFQLTMFLAAFVAGLLALVLIGFFLLIVIGVLMVVFPVIAAVRTDQGDRYRYPLTIRFVK